MKGTMIRKFSLLCFFVLCGLPALGGGSLARSDIQPLLDQQPAIWKFYLDHFDIDSVGWAPRIGGRRALDGSRIAPYSFAAKPKGQPGPFTLYIVIEADTYFYDDAGKDSDMDHGTSYKETLTKIAVAPMQVAKEPSAHSPR